MFSAAACFQQRHQIVPASLPDIHRPRAVGARRVQVNLRMQESVVPHAVFEIAQLQGPSSQNLDVDLPA
jgi:hypothetical protein